MNTYGKKGEGVSRLREGLRQHGSAGIKQPMIEVVERQKGMGIRPFLPHKKIRVV